MRDCWRFLLLYLSNASLENRRCTRYEQNKKKQKSGICASSSMTPGLVACTYHRCTLNGHRGRSATLIQNGFIMTSWWALSWPWGQRVDCWDEGGKVDEKVGQAAWYELWQACGRRMASRPELVGQQGEEISNYAIDKSLFLETWQLLCPSSQPGWTLMASDRTRVLLAHGSLSALSLASPSGDGRARRAAE